MEGDARMRRRTCPSGIVILAVFSFKGAAHATASEAAQQPMDEDGVDNVQPGLVNRQLSIDESGWY